MNPVSNARHPPPTLNTNRQNDPLRQAAAELETAFLTEMLKSAGFAKPREHMGGGAGEDHFGSLLVRAHADQITRNGGIGLAESLYQALKETTNDT